MRATLLLAGLCLLVQEAGACGYCVEDRIAATYDHGVVTRALERGHAVAFLAIETARVPGAELEKAIARELGGIAGIDRDTGRVSLRGGSLSFAYDPSRGGLGPVLNAVEKKLRGREIEATLLRVIDNAPVAKAPSRPGPKGAL